MGSLQYEVTNLLLGKIKALEPENAIKIMGYLLIQDLGEEDLMRLAYGPETLLHTLILRAKIQLGLSASSSSSTPSSPSPLNPIARPSSNPFSQSSPRIPSSPSSNSWPLSGFPSNSVSPKASPFLSYDNIRGGATGGRHSAVDLFDEQQLSDYLSFLNESSSSSMEVPDNGDSPLHRRSYSAGDACFGTEDAGGEFKPCLYFAKGFCKNGGNCKFVHAAFGEALEGGGGILGSPSKFEQIQHEDMLKLKAAAAAHQQRLVAAAAAASQFMPGGGGPSSAYNKYMNFLLQQQNDPQRAAAIMMAEDFYKYGRCQAERNELLAMASVEKATSASRQIYLTFPAESTFRDEDVSEYFSKFGPVQDVRIPYQQKRMFGFATFVYPETVRLILSKGNPHFICDSRVLVKPYKEKGRVLEKRQHQERGEFSPCLSPAGLDSRDQYELQMGGRMLIDTQELLMRRKLEEQTELQQAIELQGRRLMNLQLPDFKNNRLPQHYIPHHFRSLSMGAPVPLSPQSHGRINQNVFSFDSFKQEVAEGFDDMPTSSFTMSVAAAVSEQQLQKEANNENDLGKEQISDVEAHDIQERVEQVLPDSLFASPSNSGEGHIAEDLNETIVVPDKNSSTSVNSATSVSPQ